MRKGIARLIVSLLLVAASAGVPAFAANGVLDNHGVIEMVQLGLSQEVIEAKIHSSPTNFDTSPKALARLKHAHVPASIITAMIDAGSGSGSVAAGSAGAAPGNASFQFVASDGSRQAMSPVRVTAQISTRKAWIPFYHGGPETFLFIDGRHATLHTSGTPTFVTNMNPINVRLVHLGEKKDRDARYVVFSGSTTDREVQVTTKMLGNGAWQVTPAAPLVVGGEYAFLVSPDLPTACGFWTCFAQYAGTSEAYDFSVQ
ncbi:MAG TPA: hypothetical protein VF284_11450 [Rhodanobacteraceae bacterium]